MIVLLDLLVYFITISGVLFGLKLIRKRLYRNKTLMIVMGSGGHTGEMAIMLKNLKFDKFDKIVFVYSNNDNNSIKKIKETFKITNNVTFQTIYRSRNVGQSFKSSILTTILAFLHSIYIIFKHRPNMIVTNGPGVSLPLCYSGYILNKMLILIEFKILFIESFCRTENLSLSGKLIKPISNKFIVLWKSLENKGEYLGKII